jgi:DNA-binding MarR family transcriptional regulator
MSKINSRPSDPGRELATAVILFHETLARKAGMSAAESRCLGILAERQTMTAGELARATGLTTGAITGIVDRLERAGWARREPNPADRRSVLIHALPHPDLEAVLAPAYARLRGAMAGLIGGFTAEELRAVGRYVTGATEVLRALTDELRSGGSKSSRQNSHDR